MTDQPNRLTSGLPHLAKQITSTQSPELTLVPLAIFTAQGTICQHYISLYDKNKLLESFYASKMDASKPSFLNWNER